MGHVTHGMGTTLCGFALGWLFPFGRPSEEHTKINRVVCVVGLIGYVMLAATK
jgi:hypothetical protein